MLRSTLSITSLYLFRMVLQFFLQAGVAVYIDPSDVGTIAFALSLLQGLNLAGEFGMCTAITREKNVSPKELGATYTFSVLVGLAMALTWCFVLPTLFIDFMSELAEISPTFSIILFL